MNEAGQKVCLCMIVKNEAPVIARCLGSLRALIDHWVIVDTGSSDETKTIVRDSLHGVAGELYERPWVNFGHNRSESLALARGRAEYVLIIDADEQLVLDPEFRLPPLTADAYQFRVQSGGVSYFKTQLVKDALNWYYKGVLHEYIHSDQPYTQTRMVGVHTLRIQDGARARDPLTYRRDALLLEEALLSEPENPRTMFYLAQSYADAREFGVAIERYRRRVVMGGWAEEVWCSLYRVAQLLQQTGAPWGEVMAAYLAAYSFRPDRAEPLFFIGFNYSSQKEFALAAMFLEQAMKLPFPEADLLFVDRHIYEVQLPLEFAVVCYYVGRHSEAIAIADRLLSKPDLTDELRERIVKNRSFSVEALQAANESAL